MKPPDKIYMQKLVNGKPTMVATTPREFDVLKQLKEKTFAKLNKEK
jgi:hypothetical protein